MNWTVENLDVDQMDVETALLEGTLEENTGTHVKCPPGMKLDKDECLEIREGMCGSVQNAGLHWLKMRKILESPDAGIKKSEADQCPFVKIGKKETVTLFLCVDDSCIFRARSDTDDVTMAMKSEESLCNQN